MPTDIESLIRFTVTFHQKISIKKIDRVPMSKLFQLYTKISDVGLDI